MKKLMILATAVAAWSAMALADVVLIPHGGLTGKQAAKKFTPEAIKQAYDRKQDRVIMSVDWDGSAFKSRAGAIDMTALFKAAAPKENPFEIVIRAKGDDETWFEPLDQAVKAAGLAPSKVRVFARMPWQLAPFHAKHPEYELGLSGDLGMSEGMAKVKKYAQQGRKLGIKAVIIDHEKAGKGCLSKASIQLFRDAGMEIRFWEPGADDAELKDMLSYEPSAICAVQLANVKKRLAAVK